MIFLSIFFENNDDDYQEEDFQAFVTFIHDQGYLNFQEEFTSVLRLILNVANNYHRDFNFIPKLNKILNYFKDLIKETFTNQQIYQIFKSNKLILLFLNENEILNIGEIVSDKKEEIGIDTLYYFYPEINEKIDEVYRKQMENEFLSKHPTIFENFEEKRLKGENETYLSSLIRSDQVEEFVSLVTRESIKLDSTIEKSIFETNCFLIDKNPTLIEYATFYGSIQIYQYLRLNKVDMQSSLWHFAIHSNNPELIHLLEENEIESPDDNYESCLIESIKCHHNAIANYIRNSKMDKKLDSRKMIEKVYKNSAHYFNYSYFPYEINSDCLFFSILNYKHYDIVSVFIKNKKKEIHSILKISFYSFSSS